MLNKIKNKLYPLIGLAGGAGYILSAHAAGAQVPDASTTLATIMGTVVTTTVDLVTIVFTTYWPYVLIFGIIAGLVALFTRFAHLGTGRGK
jgi:hypothetical protein